MNPWLVSFGIGVPEKLSRLNENAKVHNERTRIARASLRNPNAESESPSHSNPGVLSESTRRINPEHLNESLNLTNPLITSEPKRLRNPEPLNESLNLTNPVITSEPINAEPINASTELRELIMDIHRRRYPPSAIHSATDLSLADIEHVLAEERLTAPIAVSIRSRVVRYDEFGSEERFRSVLEATATGLKISQIMRAVRSGKPDAEGCTWRLAMY